MKTQSQIADAFKRISMWGSYSPIAQLNPQSLTGWMERFRTGHMRELVLAWDEVKERDDVISSVEPKRKKAVSGCDWVINQVDDSEEAVRHAEALEELYNNITASDATDEDVTGGLDMLIRQIMNAVGYKYNVHEIVWQPGDIFTAECINVPLRFFERSTGKLRFNAASGSPVDLNPDEWLIAATDMPPLMKATIIAYLYKTMPLRDWLTYSEANGLLYVLFKSNAAPGTQEWTDAEDAVSKLAGIFGAVVSEGTEFEKMGAGGTELPYPKLIERMDRAISAIWRGSDLSTMSADNKGASLQGDETRILLEDDCKFVGNTLNHRLGRKYIELRFGAGVRPLAYLEVQPPMDVDEEKEQKKFTTALEDGLSVSVTQYREKTGIREPDDEADALNPSAQPKPPATPDDDEEATATAANEASDEVIEALGGALRQDFLLVTGILGDIETAETLEDYADARERFEEALAAIQDSLDPSRSALAGTLQAALGDAVVTGAATLSEELKKATDEE
jgi:phage gp29-like protein